MNLGSAGHRSAIEAALLDYHRSPGRYALAGRQPAVLFAAIKEVLQLASGRSPEGDASAGPTAAVRQAAGFFIKSALLHPGADHYALLGLPRTADAGAVKDRYRLMMRLMHPDFSGQAASMVWPADAATRVNQAYEILSSGARRGAYDEQTDPAPPVSPQPERRASSSRVATVPVSRPAGMKPAAEDPRRRLKRLAAVFGTAGGLGVLAVWTVGNHAERESLVQRAPAALPEAAQAHPVPLAALPPAGPVTLPPAPQAPLLHAAAPTAAAPVSSFPPREPAPAAFVLAAPVVPAPVPLAVAFTPTFTAPVPTAPVAMGTAAMPAAMPAAVPAPAPAAISSAALPARAPEVAVASVPVAAVPVPAVATKPSLPGPTMAEVHSLLSRLLQEIESGWGDRVLSQLDRDARSEPGAQALLRRYNSVVDGTRPVTLAKVQFRGEPRDGRLLVTGRVLIQVRDHAGPPRELAMQAEFASRDGTVVMTRLAQAQE